MFLFDFWAGLFGLIVGIIYVYLIAKLNIFDED